MKLNANNAVLELKPGQIVTLDDADGASVTVRTGSLWITEEGELKDIVLSPGEKRVITHPGRTLMQAMRTTWVAICTPQMALN